MNSDLINKYIPEIIKSIELMDSWISDERVSDLFMVSEKILGAIDEFGQAGIIFICTHNSRRSQLAQAWLLYWIDFINLQNIRVFSGGTEATAFNVRMVKALMRAGFSIEMTEESDNPHYRFINAGPGLAGAEFFSKEYNHPINPQEDFIAIMVCDQADADCPFIPGAYKRFSLPYEDPKRYDGTAEESHAYDQKVLEIGREMYLLACLVEDASS